MHHNRTSPPALPARSPSVRPSEDRAPRRRSKRLTSDQLVLLAVAAIALVLLLVAVLVLMLSLRAESDQPHSGASTDVGAGVGAGVDSDGKEDAAAASAEEEPEAATTPTNDGSHAATPTASDEVSGDAPNHNPLGKHEPAELESRPESHLPAFARTFEIAAEPAAAVGAEEGGEGERSRFFGIEAHARRIAYVVDASGSMHGERFQLACDELQRSIDELDAEQSFFVVFFNSSTFPQPDPAGPAFWSATEPNREQIERWIDSLHADGGTQPLNALLLCLELEPDIIYLLSDGQIPVEVSHDVELANRAAIPIHTVSFYADPSANALLELISTASGGQHRQVP